VKPDEWLGRFRVFWTSKLDTLATEVARGKKQRRNSKGAPAVNLKSRRGRS